MINSLVLPVSFHSCLHDPLYWMVSTHHGCPNQKAYSSRPFLHLTNAHSWVPARAQPRLCPAAVDSYKFCPGACVSESGTALVCLVLGFHFEWCLWVPLGYVLCDRRNKHPGRNNPHPYNCSLTLIVIFLCFHFQPSSFPPSVEGWPLSTHLL